MTLSSHWFLFLFAQLTNFLELGFVIFCIVASVITEFQALRNFSDTLILRASEDRWLSVIVHEHEDACACLGKVQTQIYFPLFA